MKDKTHLRILDEDGNTIWHGPIPGARTQKRRIKELTAALTTCSDKLERFTARYPDDSIENLSATNMVKYARAILDKYGRL